MTEPAHPGNGGLQPYVRWFARSAGAQLVVAGLVLAFAFPASASGAIGLTILGGALGIGAAALWPRVPAKYRQPPSVVTSAIIVLVVVVTGLSTFWPVLAHSSDWPMGDWGPQHAVLARVLDNLSDAPTWNHALSTGDAPLELYPSLAYYVAGYLAKLFGLEGDLVHALFLVAMLVHIGIAVATTLIAARVAPKPFALVVGLLSIVETGAIAHGGSVGLFHWALLHSALALALAGFAAYAVVCALQRPRILTSAAIWILTALSCIAHPAGLLAAATAIVGLIAVALLASDVRPRTAMAAAFHVGLGVLLGAAVWMPLAERIFTYGQHYPNPIRSAAQLLENILQFPSPVTAFALVMYAAYFGIIAGLWSRRGPLVFVATCALLLVVNLSDAAYLAFDLAPGTGVARLGTERLVQLARPFLGACAAYGLHIIVSATLTAWRATPRSRRHALTAAAVAGIMTCAVLRIAPSVWWGIAGRAANEARVYAPDESGRRQLTEWAERMMRDSSPERFGRAMFETDTHEHMHLTALTGLPTFHPSWLPDLLLRERIEDTSEASLRRFNVRWVIARDASPTLGDPGTEVTLGSYRVREIATWDGKFARVEKGTGDAHVTRLDDRAVEVDLTGTAEPALVVLGTGHYPRWRVTHDGNVLPVYAYPTVTGGRLHVVAAWLPPGKSTFTCDGPLPSDGKGRGLSILSLLTALALAAAWLVRPLRRRVLRAGARVFSRIRRHTALAVRIVVPLGFVLVAIRGCTHATGPTRAIELGTGLRSTATVEARSAGIGSYEECTYSRLEGIYYCGSLAVAYDGMVGALNDAPPSWAFNTPGIVVEPQSAGPVDVRIRLRPHLAGTYWMSATGGDVRLTVDGETGELPRGVKTYDERGPTEVTISMTIGSEPRSFTAVREDTLLPPRDYLVAPPEAAPSVVH